VRPATSDDLARVVAVDERAAAGDPERRTDLRRHVEVGECLVRMADGEVVGYAVVRRQHFFGRDFMELLSVAAPARRAGHGSALLGAAREQAGTAQIFTSTNRSNDPMRRLLEQTGWQFSGELDGLDPGDPELVYFTWRGDRPR
jgi:ribosomal protein S18 acetylase RimI-like enzyme